MTIRLKQLIFKFCSDNSGQVIIIFAVLLIPMAVILGGALDVAHQYNQFKKLQTSIDLANLAVAKEVGRNPSVKSAQLNKIAEIIMQANLPRSSAIDLEPFNIIRSKKSVSITQSGTVNTGFLKMIGMRKLSINAKSIVNINSSEVEVALVLDMSGSMGGSRLWNLKAASRDLINTLLPKNRPDGNTRIALVPWNTAVYVGNYRRKIIRGNYRGKYRCARARSNYYHDVSGRKVKLPIGGRWNRYYRRYYEYCPNRPIIPLTKSNQVLNREVSYWQAGGGTDSSAGLALGWGVLSPVWNDVWPISSRAKQYGKAKKYIILMTDGSNGSRQADSASTRLCAAMKRKKILIYAIAYGARGRAASMLRSCVSKPNMYINATSAAVLKQAFKDIASEIGAIHIAR